MAQRYRHPAALKRMALDTCPECGRASEEHGTDLNTVFLHGLAGGCDLLRQGVEDRIAQYRADLTEAP